MPSDLAKRLNDRRLNVWQEADSLATGAANENRAFTAEEQGKWEALNTEIDNLDKRIKSVLETEQRAADADAAFNALEQRRQTGPGGQQFADRDKQNDEVRKFLKGENGAPKSMEIRRDPALGAFGQQDLDRLINYRVLSTLTTGAGGNLAPTDFYDQLIAHLIEVSGVMQAGPTVLNTTGGEVLQVPKTTGHSTAASAAQAGAIPTSDPSFGLATLGSFKYGILLQVARELIDDSGVDLMGYLAMQAGRAIGNKFGADLVTGTGTGQPTGFLGSATVGVTGTTTGVGGVPSYGNLVDLEYSVIAPYRASRSCFWMAQDKTIGAFRKIVDGNGRPIWEPSMALGSPDLLLGKPLVADPFMPALAAGGVFPIAFGDFSQFFVRMVGGVRFERSDDFLFGSDLVAFRALLRGDGTLVDLTGAIKKFQTAAT